MIQYPDGTTGIAEMSCEEPPLGFSWDAKQVEWSLGDYVWGKISGYPWWPGIVSPDPDLGIFTKMQGRSRIYHIQFFGDAEETGWVHSTLLMKFEGKKAFDEYVKNILQNARPSEKLRLEKLYREFAGCVDDLNDAVKETESYLQSKENKMIHSITDEQEEDEKETAVSDITQESLTGLKSNVSKFSTKKRNSSDNESEDDDEDIDQDYEELITVQVIIDEELLENDKIGENFAVGHKKEVNNTVSCHDKSLNQVHVCIGHDMDEKDHSNNDFAVKPGHTKLSSIIDVQMTHTNQNMESMPDSGIHVYKDRLKSCSVSLQRLSMNSVKLLKQGTIPSSHIITGKYHQDHKNVLPDEKEHQVDNNTKQTSIRNNLNSGDSKIINVTSTNGENQMNSSLPITLEKISNLIDYATTVNVTNEDEEVQNSHTFETDNTQSSPETIQDRYFSSQTEKDLHLSPYVQDINNSGHGHANLAGGLCDSYQEIKSQNTAEDIRHTDEHYVDKTGSGNDGVVKNGFHNNRMDNGNKNKNGIHNNKRTIPVAIESASSERELKEKNNKSSSKDFAEEVSNTTVSKEMHEICPINLDLCNGVDGEEPYRNILTERIDQNIGNLVSRRTRTKLTKTKQTNSASNIIPFKCNICDRTIGDLIGLKMHLQSHANLNAYSHSYKHSDSNREEQLKLCSVALTPISKYVNNRLKTGSFSVSMLKRYPPSQQKNARRSRHSSTVSDCEKMCISDTKSKTDNIINAPSKRQQNEIEISKETKNVSNKNGRNKRESKNKDSQQSGKNSMGRQHKDILVKCPKDKLRGINLTKITEKNENKKNGLNKPVSSIEYSRCNMMTNHVNRNELSTEITRDPLKSAEEQNVLRDVKKTGISRVLGNSPSVNDKKLHCSKTPTKDNYSHSIGNTTKRKIRMESNPNCTTKVAKINNKIIEKSVEKKRKDLKANAKEKAGHIDLTKHAKGDSVCRTKDRSTASDKTPETHVSNNLSNDTLKKGKKKQFYCDKCEKNFRHQRELDVHKPCNAHIKRFKCLFCDKAFSLDYNRTKHEKIHTGDGQCECSICHKTFSCAAYLKHHVMLHTGEYPVRCKICDRGFPNESTLSHHMKIRHTDERPFECDICGKRFKSKHTLKEHLISHTGEKPYKCSLCDKRYTKTCKRKLHEESFHHGIKRHSCQYCGIKFAKLYSLQQHLNKHTGEKRYKCRVCDKLFPYYSTCRTHEREIHEAVKPFKCSECGVAFTKKEKLEEHKLFHLRKSKTARIKEQLYSCELCDKKFTVPSSLKDHMNIHLGLKPYKCTLCDRAFSKPNSLRDHYKRTVHEGERSFTCDCCGHTFGMKIILDKHVKNFTVERPLQCHFCDRRFPMKCGLDKHISQNHVGDDAYECKICHVKLKGSSMKRHMKSHGQTDGDDSDQPNFKCSTCGVPFKKKGSLLSHIRLNHSGTSTQSILFNCSICGINFNEQKGLNKHKEIKHRIKNEKKRGTTCECSICGIAYIAKRDMEKHIKGQHVEKSSNKNIIECSSCKVIFTSKSVMNKHKQIKHGAKPYEPKHLFECRVCGIKLRSSQSRKNHEMNVHPDRSSQPSKKADRKGSA